MNQHGKGRSVAIPPLRARDLLSEKSLVALGSDDNRKECLANGEHDRAGSFLAEQYQGIHGERALRWNPRGQ